jgi:hypothetical protein
MYRMPTCLHNSIRTFAAPSLPALGPFFLESVADLSTNKEPRPAFQSGASQ